MTHGRLPRRLLSRVEGVRSMTMDFISLAAFLALATGSPTPAAKVEATCCSVTKAKAPVKVDKAEGYICPITGQVLPCPSCCPAAAEATK